MEGAGEHFTHRIYLMFGKNTCRQLEGRSKQQMPCLSDKGGSQAAFGGTGLRYLGDPT